MRAQVKNVKAFIHFIKPCANCYWHTFKIHCLLEKAIEINVEPKKNRRQEDRLHLNLVKVVSDGMLIFFFFL